MVAEIIALGSFIITVIATIIAYKKYKENKELYIRLNKYNTYIGEINVTINEFPKSDQELKGNLEQKKFFIKKNLIKEEILIFSPSVQYTELIKEIGGYISEDDKDILLSAAAICKVDVEGKGDLASQMYHSFIQKYKIKNLEKRAIHIYNNLNSGSFQENLLPYLNELHTFLSKNDPNIPKLFNEYYEDLLQFVVNRMWVPGYTYAHQDIKNMIDDRFKNYEKLNKLYIFSRAPTSIRDTQKACEDFIEENKGKFRYESKDRMIMGKIAKDFIITRK